VSLDKLVHPSAEMTQFRELTLCLPPMLNNDLKLGDRVTIFNKHEKQLVGTVRWFGAAMTISPKQITVVGIETVSNTCIYIMCMIYIHSCYIYICSSCSLSN